MGAEYSKEMWAGMTASFGEIPRRKKSEATRQQEATEAAAAEQGVWAAESAMATVPPIPAYARKPHALSIGSEYDEKGDAEPIMGASMMESALQHESFQLDSPPSLSLSLSALPDLPHSTTALTLNQLLLLIHRESSCHERVREVDGDLLSARERIAALTRRCARMERELHALDEGNVKQQKVDKNGKENAANGVEPAVDGGNTSDEDDAEQVAPIQHQAEYESLISFLRCHPIYLARLARVLRHSEDDIGAFVQFVMYDLYGDAFDTSSERLLLELFDHAFQAEVDECEDPATLFRTNTALTQLMSAYVRRAPCLAVLKEMLEEPLSFICSDPDAIQLDLELRPVQVYANNFEMDSTAVVTSGHYVNDEHPLIQAQRRERSNALAMFADLILHRIWTSVERFPWGMRWMCRRLAQMYVEKFGTEEEKTAFKAFCELNGEEPDAGNLASPTSMASSSSSSSPSSHDHVRCTSIDSVSSVSSSSPSSSSSSSLSSVLSDVTSRKIQSLQGGFIFLRFILPAIVSPEAFNFMPMNMGTETNPIPKTLRRTLLLLAKIMQQLSNGMEFGEKEAYMQVMNAWIQVRKDAMRRFFDELTTIDDRTSHDPTNATSSLQTIATQRNHLYSLHGQLQRHRRQIYLPSDNAALVADRHADASAQAPPSLSSLLARLPRSAPTLLPREEDVEVRLHLSSENGPKAGVVEPFSAGSPSSSAAVQPAFSPSQSCATADGSMKAIEHRPSDAELLALHAQQFLFDVLKQLPSETEHQTLMRFLLAQKVAAMEAEDVPRHDTIGTLLSTLSILHERRMLQSTVAEAESGGMDSTPSDSTNPADAPRPDSCTDESVAKAESDIDIDIAGAHERAYDEFLRQCCTPLLQQHHTLKYLLSQKPSVNDALRTIEQHHTHLRARLKRWKDNAANHMSMKDVQFSPAFGPSAPPASSPP